MKTFADRIAAWWAPVNKVAESLMTDSDTIDVHNEDIRMIVEGLLGLANDPEGKKAAIALCASFLNNYAEGVRIIPTSYCDWSIESTGSDPQKLMLRALYKSEINL